MTSFLRHFCPATGYSGMTSLLLHSCSATGYSGTTSLLLHSCSATGCLGMTFCSGNPAQLLTIWVRSSILLFLRRQVHQYSIANLHSGVKMNNAKVYSPSNSVQGIKLFDSGYFKPVAFNVKFFFYHSLIKLTQYFTFFFAMRFMEQSCGLIIFVIVGGW